LRRHPRWKAEWHQHARASRAARGARFYQQRRRADVTRVHRLARSIGDLQDIVRTLKAKGASLKATEQPIDTSTAAGKCFLDMLGVFAEFETNLRRERQLERIAKAKTGVAAKWCTRCVPK
jgi:hypothetical protein